MKNHYSTRSAFFNRRVLIGFAFSLISVALALFAFGFTPLTNGNSPTDTPNWIRRLGSILGLHVDTAGLASVSAGKGGGAPISKSAGEQRHAPVQRATGAAVAYAGPT